MIRIFIKELIIPIFIKYKTEPKLKASMTVGMLHSPVKKSRSIMFSRKKIIVSSYNYYGTVDVHRNLYCLELFYFICCTDLHNFFL